MQISKINFSLGRTVPLQTLSGLEEDRFANIKPFTSVTVEFGPDEVPINGKITAQVKDLVQEAFDKATSMAFEQMASFSKELRALYKKP